MTTSELRGWKAIADYIGVTVRTAQRWEANLALPVRREAAGVTADPAALDAWLRSATTVGRDLASPASAPPEPAEAETPVRTAHALAPSSAPSSAPPPPGPALRGRGVMGLILACAGVSAAVSFSVARLAVPALPVVRPIVPSGSPSSNIVGDRRGQLMGRIAIDANGNGQWDAGERFVAEPGRECTGAEAVPGFVVAWNGPAAGSTAAMNCNPEPFYHGGLPPGRYVASLRMPDGWRATSAARATVDVESGRDTHLWFTVQRPRRR